MEMGAQSAGTGDEGLPTAGAGPPTSGVDLAQEAQRTQKMAPLASAANATLPLRRQCPALRRRQGLSLSRELTARSDNSHRRR